jgi:rubrerythrin
MLERLTLRSAVEFAVKTEEAGGIFYSKMAKRFSDNKKLSAIFEELAKEEAGHESQFKALLDQVPEEPFLKSQREKLAVLRAISMSEFFLGESGLFKNLDEIKTPKDVYRRAYQLEKDTLMFYLEMRQILGDNDVLDEIIEAEERHVLAFTDLLAQE